MRTKVIPGFRDKLSLFLLCAIAGNAQQLKIYHIDVDQADATLFIAPNGSTLLVDAGENGKGNAIKKYLYWAKPTPLRVTITRQTSPSMNSNTWAPSQASKLSLDTSH